MREQAKVIQIEKGLSKLSYIYLFFQGLFLCSLMMTIAWGIALRLNFYSLVDVFWSYGLGLLVFFYALIGEGEFVDNVNKVTALTLALVWSLRLGTYLLVRQKSHYPQEDTRYSQLKRSWTPLRFYIFFLMQGVSQSVFSLPFLLLIKNNSPTLSVTVFIGFLIFFVGVLGGSLADMQLYQFRKLEKNKGQVCHQGLWRYSRHPNYFFEWLSWCGIAVTALSSPYGPLALVSPALMFLTLNFFTGVPASEQQALLSRGEAYREYQKNTNRFFPGVRL